MKLAQRIVTRCTNRPDCPCDFCVTVRADIATGRDMKTQEDRIALDFILEYLTDIVTRRRAITTTDELECQDSPVLAVLRHYGSPETREEYLAVSYLGEVDPEDEIPVEVEKTFPEQFRRKTLIETPPASEKVQ